MSLIRRLVKLLAMLATAIVVVTIAVANRQDATLVLDPFKPENPVVSVSAPFFLFLLGAMVIGMILGGVASWFSQGKWRKTARQRTREAYKWKQEADRLTQERDASVRPALPAA
ncbi:MAG: LapA family protein [Pseudomonadota bacterium]